MKTAIWKPCSSPGPLAPERVEEPEPAVITPAMLEEEEQLEAAGLERERKMLEKVTSGMKLVDLEPVVT